MEKQIRLNSTGEIFTVYFIHSDGVAIVTKNGVKILRNGEFEYI